jgi:uncharacterized protein (DUF433 family)
VPLIVGTTIKVVELVLDVLAYGWSPDEPQFRHPHLTLGQIHSALAYYWDHKEELDRDIERRLERVEEIRCKLVPLALYMDVHVPPAITNGLSGVDALTAQEDGSARLDDPPLLDRATELNRPLYTQDDDPRSLGDENEGVRILN